jgi:2-polyprenyl-3-methyl-5-hydroxy-6-metoxy-1,4-benzoquinol methylase
MHVNSCPACGWTAFAQLEVIDLEEQHAYYAPADAISQRNLTQAAQQTASNYSMRRCSRCGLEHADPMLAPNEAWYALAYSALDLYPEERWEFAHVLRHSSSDTLVFDIGCGDGAFLKLCTSAGMRCMGADFVLASVRRCRDQGLDAQLLDIGATHVGDSEGAATVVTAFQVLEHLQEPRRLFDIARSVSAEGATLWVAVPGINRPARVLGERDYLDQPPHHLTRWTQESLAALGRRGGWVLMSVEFEPLDLSAALWWITTRTRLYRFCVTSRAGNLRLAERIVRYLMYPYALMLRATRYRSMAGFSMLGRFRKSAAVSA